MVRGTARDGEEPRVRETSRAFGPSLAPGTRGRRVGSPALVTRGTGGGRTASGASALGVPNPAGPPGREEEHLELEARRCAGSERSRPICSPLRPAPKGPGRLYWTPPARPSGALQTRCLPPRPRTHPLPAGARATSGPMPPLPASPPRGAGLHFPQSCGGAARASGVRMRGPRMVGRGAVPAGRKVVASRMATSFRWGCGLPSQELTAR